MGAPTGDRVFREPRLLYILFLVFAMGMAPLVCLGLSGGAKYAILAALVLFAIWPIANILRPRTFAAIRGGQFEIENTETWKIDSFPLSQLKRVSLEFVAQMGNGGPEGGINFQHRLTLDLHDAPSIHYLLPYRASICEEVARELNARRPHATATLAEKNPYSYPPG